MNIEQAFSDLRMDMSPVVAAFNNAGTKHRRAQRYRWADSHRHNLIESGKYIRTSERRPTISIVQPEDPYHPTVAELRAATKVPGLVPTTNFEYGISRAEAAERGNAFNAALDRLNGEVDALTCHCGRIACRHHQEKP